MCGASLKVGGKKGGVRGHAREIER
jgi:hypothetical protein